MKLIVVLIALVPFAMGTWVKEMENPTLIEGDMVLTDEQLHPETVEPGNAFAARKRQYMWPKTIPYAISRELQGTRAVRAISQAIAEYHKHTCIRFVKRSRQAHYFEFYNSGGGCFSPVGYHREKNRISLGGEGCWSKDTVMHEMGHSLGMYHEQSRPDRDKYITIDLRPVPKNLQGNFKKQPYSNIDSRGSPYDYRSMMHYDKSAFGAGKTTIYTKDKNYQMIIGTGSGFSRQDIIQLNKMYGCPATNIPLGPQPTANCYDKSPACPNSKEQGHCTSSSWRSWISKNCFFSCGLCKGGTGGGGTNTGGGGTNTGGGTCRDSSNDCRKYYRNCRSSNTAWKNYMAKYCRKTCRYCR